MRAFVRGMLRGVMLMTTPVVATIDWSMDPRSRKWWYHYMDNYRQSLSLTTIERPVSHESDEP